MRNAGLDEAQAAIKNAWELSINSDDTTLMAESEEELNSLLMKVKVESEKVGSKLSIQKERIRADQEVFRQIIEIWYADGILDTLIETSQNTVFFCLSARLDLRHHVGTRVL